MDKFKVNITMLDRLGASIAIEAEGYGSTAEAAFKDAVSNIATALSKSEEDQASNN